MLKNGHIIQRLTLEIGLDSREKNFEVQSQLSDICKNIIPALLDEELSKLSGSEKVISIDKLQIELPAIQLSNLKEDFVKQLRRVLREKISELSRSSSNIELSIEDSALYAIEDYLTTGKFPWWINTNRISSIDSLILHLMKHRPEKLKKVISEKSKDKRIISRISSQLSTQTSRKLLEVFNVIIPSDIIYLIERLCGIVTKKHDRNLANKITSLVINDFLETVVSGTKGFSDKEDVVSFTLDKTAELLKIKKERMVTMLVSDVNQDPALQGKIEKVIEKNYLSSLKYITNSLSDIDNQMGFTVAGKIFTVFSRTFKNESDAIIQRLILDILNGKISGKDKHNLKELLTHTVNIAKNEMSLSGNEIYQELMISGMEDLRTIECIKEIVHENEFDSLVHRIEQFNADEIAITYAALDSIFEPLVKIYSQGKIKAAYKELYKSLLLIRQDQLKKLSEHQLIIHGFNKIAEILNINGPQLLTSLTISETIDKGIAKSIKKLIEDSFTNILLLFIKSREKEKSLIPYEKFTRLYHSLLKEFSEPIAHKIIEQVLAKLSTANPAQTVLLSDSDLLNYAFSEAASVLKISKKDFVKRLNAGNTKSKSAKLLKQDLDTFSQTKQIPEVLPEAIPELSDNLIIDFNPFTEDNKETFNQKEADFRIKLTSYYLKYLSIPGGNFQVSQTEFERSIKWAITQSPDSFIKDLILIIHNDLKRELLLDNLSDETGLFIYQKINPFACTFVENLISGIKTSPLLSETFIHISKSRIMDFFISGDINYRFFTAKQLTKNYFVKKVLEYEANKQGIDFNDLVSSLIDKVKVSHEKSTTLEDISEVVIQEFKAISDGLSVSSKEKQKSKPEIHSRIADKLKEIPKILSKSESEIDKSVKQTGFDNLHVLPYEFYIDMLTHFLTNDKFPWWSRQVINTIEKGSFRASEDTDIFIRILTHISDLKPERRMKILSGVFSSELLTKKIVLQYPQPILHSLFSFGLSDDKKQLAEIITLILAGFSKNKSKTSVDWTIKSIYEVFFRNIEKFSNLELNDVISWLILQTSGESEKANTELFKFIEEIIESDKWKQSDSDLLITSYIESIRNKEAELITQDKIFEIPQDLAILAEKEKWNLIKSFLTKGIIPEGFDMVDRLFIADSLDEIIDRQEFNKEFKDVLNSSDAIDRIIYYFPVTSSEKLLSALSTEAGIEYKSISDRLYRLLTDSLPNLGRSKEIRSLINKLALKKILTKADWSEMEILWSLIADLDDNRILRPVKLKERVLHKLAEKELSDENKDNQDILIYIHKDDSLHNEFEKTLKRLKDSINKNIPDLSDAEHKDSEVEGSTRISDLLNNATQQSLNDAIHKTDFIKEDLKPDAPLPEEAVSVDALIYYLKYGFLPWWYPYKNFNEFEVKVSTLIHDFKVILKTKITPLLKDPIFRQRLLGQFSDNTKNEIVRILLEEEQQPVLYRTELLFNVLGQHFGEKVSLHEYKNIVIEYLIHLSSEKFTIKSEKVIKRMLEFIAERNQISFLHLTEALYIISISDTEIESKELIQDLGSILIEENKKLKETIHRINEYSDRIFPVLHILKPIWLKELGEKSDFELTTEIIKYLILETGIDEKKPDVNKLLIPAIQAVTLATGGDYSKNISRLINAIINAKPGELKKDVKWSLEQQLTDQYYKKKKLLDIDKLDFEYNAIVQKEIRKRLPEIIKQHDEDKSDETINEIITLKINDKKDTLKEETITILKRKLLEWVANKDYNEIMSAETESMASEFIKGISDAIYLFTESELKEASMSPSINDNTIDKNILAFIESVVTSDSRTEKSKDESLRHEVPISDGRITKTIKKVKKSGAFKTVILQINTLFDKIYNEGSLDHLRKEIRSGSKKEMRSIIEQNLLVEINKELKTKNVKEVLRKKLELESQNDEDSLKDFVKNQISHIDAGFVSEHLGVLEEIVKNTEINQPQKEESLLYSDLTAIWVFGINLLTKQELNRILKRFNVHQQNINVDTKVLQTVIWFISLLRDTDVETIIKQTENYISSASETIYDDFYVLLKKAEHELISNKDKFADVADIKAISGVISGIDVRNKTDQDSKEKIILEKFAQSLEEDDYMVRLQAELEIFCQKEQSTKDGSKLIRSFVAFKTAFRNLAISTPLLMHRVLELYSKSVDKSVDVVVQELYKKASLDKYPVLFMVLWLLISKHEWIKDKHITRKIIWDQQRVQTHITGQMVSNDDDDTLPAIDKLINKDEVFDFLKDKNKQTAYEKLVRDKHNWNDDKGLEEMIYIQNAGLVLLCIFFPKFFENLGLLKDGEFLDSDSRERAVHIIQYLATGEEQTPEYLLMLNKILCGLHLEQPVRRNIFLSDEEKKECDKLLQSAINNWPLIKNTSIEGFRKTFLIRDGIMMKKNNNWNLKIENKGVDIILRKLPWGFSTLKMSWNKYIIFVEWIY